MDSHFDSLWLVLTGVGYSWKTRDLFAVPCRFVIASVRLVIFHLGANWVPTPRALADIPVTPSGFAIARRRVRMLALPPQWNFERACATIAAQPARRTPQLETTGGKPFPAEAKVAKDGRRFICLPHDNRIYESDWGTRHQQYGKDGQRIGHYSVPIDDWARRVG